MRNILKQESFFGRGITEEFEKVFRGMNYKIVLKAVEKLKGFSKGFIHIFPLETTYPHCLIIATTGAHNSVYIGNPTFNNRNEEPIGYDIIQFDKIPSTKRERYRKEAFSIAKDLQTEVKRLNRKFD